MPVITDITAQKKRQGYYNIFIDGKYTLALSEADMGLFQIHPRQQIDASYLQTLCQAHTSSKCYNSAICYLAYRPRSIKEVTDYLIVRKGYATQDANTAVAKLVAQGYLNDVEFARAWVHSRLLLNPKSLSVLRMELAKKGIHQDIITSTLSDIDSGDWLTNLTELITRKQRQLKYQNKQKITEYLLRQGYNYGLIKQALELTDSF